MAETCTGHPAWLVALPTCPSTNTWVQEHRAALAPGACVWTSRQSAGRGSRGRSWLAAEGVLTASFLVHLPAVDSRLSLVAGLAVAHAVEDHAPAARVAIKWPNDCYLADRKLAGLLCERVRDDERCLAVVGIGLNLAPRWRDGIEPPHWAAVEEVAPPPEPIALLTALRRYLLQGVAMLTPAGWPRLHRQLAERDWLRERSVCIEDGPRCWRGRAAGFDADGALRVVTADGLRSVISGTVAAIDHPQPSIT